MLFHVPLLSGSFASDALIKIKRKTHRIRAIIYKGGISVEEKGKKLGLLNLIGLCVGGGMGVSTIVEGIK